MIRDLLPHFPIVLAVARLRGFAAAAHALNMSPSAVGHAVRMVEERIGEPLFARTTRSVSLTEAGQRFVAAIGPALAEIEKAVEGLQARRGEVTGLLRINAPRVAMQMVLIPILAKMAWRHPALTVEIQTEDRFVDIVSEGFDAGIRIGEAVQQDMVAVRLTPPFRAILVASPDYLRARGEPDDPAGLEHHNCIGFRLIASGSLYKWDLQVDGRDVQVRTSGTATVTDATFVRDLAISGVGIGYIFEPLAREDIRAGRLKWVLPQHAIEEDGLFLYFPRRLSQAPKLRAFIDCIRDAG